MTVRALFKAAAEQVAKEASGQLIVINERPLALKLEFPDGVTLCTYGTHVPLNARATSKIMRDKAVAAAFLKSEGFFSPEGHSFNLNLENFPAVDNFGNSKAYKEMKSFIDTVGFPAFIKPNDGSKGKRVFQVDNRSILVAYLGDLAHSKNQPFLIQEACIGREYRIITIREEIALALEKKSLSVIGDGMSTMRKLIRKELSALRQSGRKITITSSALKIRSHLARQGFSLKSVPEAGRHITVLANKNLSDGGTPKPCTDDIRAKYSELCRKICNRLNVEYCGIDLIEDIRAGEIRPYIIELNGSPGYGHFVRSAPEHADMVKQVFVAAFRAAYEKQKEARHPHPPTPLPPKDLEFLTAKAA